MLLQQFQPQDSWLQAVAWLKAPHSLRLGGYLFGQREAFLGCHYFPASTRLMTSASAALSLPASFSNLVP